MLALVGGISFPMGLFACFVWSANLFESFGAAMLIAGWMLYASLTIAGFIRPLRIVLGILCALLVLNIGGCHLPHTAGAFSW